MALRRSDYVRYALSIQYHGAHFLGVTADLNQEDKLLDNGGDLRGYVSVETRVRRALAQVTSARGLLNSDDDTFPLFENVQFSSRTDRGVHALHNTFHVDIRADHAARIQRPSQLAKALNGRFRSAPIRTDYYDIDNPQLSILNHALPYCLRILHATQAPDSMPNPFHQEDPNKPPTEDWHARHSATERTYVYRIITCPSSFPDWTVPFEYDRAWHCSSSTTTLQQQQQHQSVFMNIPHMRAAAQRLVGTHDFSSFRGKGCERHSPIVTVREISIHEQPYGGGIVMKNDSPALEHVQLGTSGFMNIHNNNHPNHSPFRLITILVRGNAFLFRQVRNIVGCLVEVGRGRMRPEEVETILQARDRSQNRAPMAPPQGLFLAQVRHGDFVV